MCELVGAHAGASLVRGKAVAGALSVVKTATDLLASAGEYRAIVLLVAGIPCCGSWALARDGAGSLHCRARKGLRVTHQTRMSSFSTSHWKVVDLF